MTFTKNKKLDYTGSLINYVNDIKPFRTKLTSISQKYIFQDSIKASISEDEKISVILGNDAAKRSFLNTQSSKSWYKEIISDSATKSFSINSLILRTQKSLNEDKVIVGNNDGSYLIPNSDLVLFNFRKKHSGVIVSKNENYFNDTLDYFLCHGVYSFKSFDDATWQPSILSNTDTTTFDPKVVSTLNQSRSGEVLYKDQITEEVKIHNISYGNYEEWTITCNNLDGTEFTVTGSVSGLVGIASLNSNFAHIDNKIAFSITSNSNKIAKQGQQIVLTPSSTELNTKIIVLPGQGDKEWTLVRTTPRYISNVIFSQTSTVQRVSLPKLVIHAQPFSNLNISANWVIQKIDEDTISVTCDNESFIATEFNISGESLSFKNDVLSFFIDRGSDDLLVGDAFSFSTYADAADIAVYCNDGNTYPHATTGKWYWNGKIGFKIEKNKPFFTYIKNALNTVESTRSTFLKTQNLMCSSIEDFSNPDKIFQCLRQNTPILPTDSNSTTNLAKSTIYKIQFTTPLTASVFDISRGYLSGLAIGETWKDEFIEFKLKSEFTYETGDVFYLILSTKENVPAALASFDMDYYDSRGYDVPNIIDEQLTNLLQESIPFYYGQSGIAFKDTNITSGDSISIDTIQEDTIRLKIDGISTKFPNLFLQDDWFPITLKYYRDNDELADFPYLATKIRAYAFNDPNQLVFTILQPIFTQDFKRNLTGVLTFDTAFFSTYLTLGTKYALASYHKELYGNKISTAISEHVIIKVNTGSTSYSYVIL